MPYMDGMGNIPEQTTKLPKLECFGHLGAKIPYDSPPFGVTNRRGKVAITCPDIHGYSKQIKWMALPGCRTAIFTEQKNPVKKKKTSLPPGICREKTHQESVLGMLIWMPLQHQLAISFFDGRLPSKNSDQSSEKRHASYSPEKLL